MSPKFEPFCFYNKSISISYYLLTVNISINGSCSFDSTTSVKTWGFSEEMQIIFWVRRFAKYAQRARNKNARKSKSHR